MAGRGTPSSLLVGPAVEDVSDDPDGRAVLGECVEAWNALPARQRRQIRLLTLPMDDGDENAAMVNALQRHATVIVQKSLAEGFGLTVAEGMWKAKAVVASAVGGIVDQVVPGTGVLLDDPEDLDAFGDALVSLLEAPREALRLGDNARRHVLEAFVGDEHLLHYGVLMERLKARLSEAVLGPYASGELARMSRPVTLRGTILSQRSAGGGAHEWTVKARRASERLSSADEISSPIPWTSTLHPTPSSQSTWSTSKLTEAIGAWKTFAPWFVRRTTVSPSSANRMGSTRGTPSTTTPSRPMRWVAMRVRHSSCPSSSMVPRCSMAGPPAQRDEASPWECICEKCSPSLPIPTRGCQLGDPPWRATHPPGGVTRTGASDPSRTRRSELQATWTASFRHRSLTRAPCHCTVIRSSPHSVGM